MKKWGVIFLLTFILFFGTVFGEEINQNSSITGKATSAGASLTIFVNASPSIQIISPSNGTYFNTNISLNFISLSEDYVWYKLDDGANQFLSGNTAFNTTNGFHRIYLYANNSYGNSSANVAFTVNTSSFQIDFSTFNGSDGQ